MNRLEKSAREKRRKLKKMISAGLAAGFGGGFASCTAPQAHTRVQTSAAPNQADITDIMADFAFRKTDTQAYFRQASFIYTRPYFHSETVASMEKKQAVHITGIGQRSFWEAEYNGRRCYVKASDVTTDMSIINAKDARSSELAEKFNAFTEGYAQRQEEARKKLEEQKRKEKLRKKKEAEKKKKEEERKKKEKEKQQAEKTLKAQESKTKSARFADLSSAYVKATANTEKIWIYLTEHGFTDVQAAGIMGNIQCESDFNPRATDGGHGLFQWIGGRRSALYSFASDPWSIEDQLAFMIHELNTNEADAYQKFRMASTPEEAAYLWDVYYERSAGLSTGKRMKCAAVWYKTYHKETPDDKNVAHGLTEEEKQDLAKKASAAKKESEKETEKSGSDQKTADSQKVKAEADSEQKNSQQKEKKQNTEEKKAEEKADDAGSSSAD